MPSRLVFTIGATGSIEGLLKDKVLNTADMGDRKIERITMIEHDEGNQKFYIKWLTGPYAGRKHSLDMDQELFPVPGYYRETTSPYYHFFDKYDDAVDHEIKCVNKLRERGVSFG